MSFLGFTGVFRFIVCILMLPVILFILYFIAGCCSWMIADVQEYLQSLGENKMDTASVLTILLPIAGLFLWNRSEANADRREANSDRKEMNQKMETNMQETRSMVDAIRQEVKDFHAAMYAETKDFHARLCVIESKRQTIILNEKGEIK